jgi:hypothetical protein
MKATKITYYTTTGLLSLMMAFSTLAYLLNPELKEAFQHLGFPDYFRTELGIAKGLAAIALWMPFRLAKETAYIGLSISFVSAVIAHIVVGDPTFNILYPVFILAILVVSYMAYHKLSGSPGSRLY